ncbi:MAG: hypothetical protein FD137_760 [Spirochaetes bacterium]|nr:MAG: hypothetical protein FD137_760 [Spirochaetota bacterium]
MKASEIPGLPDRETLLALIEQASEILLSYAEVLRPRTLLGRPGGIVVLPQDESLLIPDLHGRADFLFAVLKAIAPGETALRVEDLLKENRLSLVCLGDVLHTEGRAAAERWHCAATRLLSTSEGGTSPNPELEEEMSESLAALSLVLRCIVAYPGAFFCLKGNHDNMGNLDSDGDKPFYKYAFEGAMCAAWFSSRYGALLLEVLRKYERSLPLVATGKQFFASHAEPRSAVASLDILEYFDKPNLVYNLIWTGNGEAEKGSVGKSISALRPWIEGLTGWPCTDTDTICWFAGHRPVNEGYKARLSDRFVQIHDPGKNQIVWVDGRGDFQLYTLVGAGLVRSKLPSGIDHEEGRH